jgi:hypothetical protein
VHTLQFLQARQGDAPVHVANMAGRVAGCSATTSRSSSAGGPDRGRAAQIAMSHRMF